MKTEARCRVFKSINPQKSVIQTAQSAVLHRACGGFIYLFVCLSAIVQICQSSAEDVVCPG